ncbi:thiol S-methyltransferase TMT1A-like [Lissotriton helveticus]
MGLLIATLQGGVMLLTLPVHLLALLGVWQPLANKMFPYLLATFSHVYNRKMHSFKKTLFSNMLDFAGPRGELNILEVGSGTGTNFQFFPPGCRVTCTDPNPDFERFLGKSVAENEHVRFTRFLVASGEDMSAVASGSADAVVCTLVLCSVRDVEGVLKEVVRVLRPGGVFYFLEHVAADKSTWSFFFQHIYHPTWKTVCCGCHLVRETWKDIEKAHFSKVNLQHIWAPMDWNPARAHIMGYAVK